MSEHSKNNAELPASSDRFEKIARILSLVAIPIVIAVCGWIIQNRLSDRNLSQEYVKLSVNILEKPKSEEVPPGLRDWAVDLLNQNSPTKFNPETIRQLKAGEINLAGILPQLLAASSTGGGIAVSPDQKLVATGQENREVRLWDVQTGALNSTLRGHTDAVTAVVFSPDAKTLYSGSDDNTVIQWDIATGRMLHRFVNTSAILGLAVSPDQKSLFVRSVGGNVQMLDLSSGRIVHQFKLGGSQP